MFQRLTADELHHEEEVVLRSEELVNRGDFRMVQLGKRRRFRPEASHDSCVRQLGVQDLDGHLAVERFIERLVDGAHASPSQLPKDSVLADGLSDHRKTHDPARVGTHLNCRALLMSQCEMSKVLTFALLNTRSQSFRAVYRSITRENICFTGHWRPSCAFLTS